MSFPLVQFVDAPDTSATVRFDCNDQTGHPKKKVNDFDPGVPTLEGDPNAVGQQWGPRQPSISMTITGTKAEALAALSDLSKEQLRRTNWLLFQPSALTRPVWFRTYRTGYEPLSLQQVWVDTTQGGPVLLPDTWKVTVPLAAEPFVYGPFVSQDTVEIIQAPADLTGPTRHAMFWVLPSIKGDAPTRLRVEIEPESPSDAGDHSQWLLGLISGSASMEHPIVDIGTADGFTAGAGTSSGSSSAAYFGGTYRTVTVSSTGTVGGNFLERLSGTLPITPRAGRYKILLRAQSDASTATKPYIFALAAHNTGETPRYQTSTTQVVNPDGDPASYLFQGWVDLGDFFLPAGGQLPTDIIAPDLGNPVASEFSLKIGTADGSAGVIRIDSLLLIPVDGPDVDAANILKARLDWAPINTYVRATFDGESDSYFAVYTNTGIRYPGAPILRGSFLEADPASEQNMILVIATDMGESTNAGATITSQNAQLALIASYYPRYLYLGDGE